ncbi:MAG: hypothetical protein ABEJ44_04805 [Halanaeroarchaeum sp.]
MTTMTHANARTRTQPVLVVLDPENPDGTLENVLRHPDLVDRELHFLLVYPTKEYETRRRARIEVGVTSPYAITHLEDEARRRALHLGYQWLGTKDGTVFAFGRVGPIPDQVRDIVEKYGYDQVYLDPKPRSIWQRVLGRIDEATSLARTLPDITLMAQDSGEHPNIENLR